MASPNRLGLFATFISFLVTVLGGLLVIGAPSFSESNQKTVGTIFFLLGGLGILFAYLTVRFFFWALRAPSHKSKTTSPAHMRAPYQPPPPRPLKELKGIGGWLIFPLLGLLAAPLFNIQGLIQQADVLLKLSTFNSAFQNLVIAETTLTVILGIIAPAFLLIKMVNHWPRFPSFWIAWVLLVAAYNVGDTLALYLMFKDQVDAGKMELFDKDTIRSYAQSFWSIVLWIPYMLLSRRVRNTFHDEIIDDYSYQRG